MVLATIPDTGVNETLGAKVISSTDTSNPAGAVTSISDTKSAPSTVKLELADAVPYVVDNEAGLPAVVIVAVDTNFGAKAKPLIIVPVAAV
jgi:hypothetical protein